MPDTHINDTHIHDAHILYSFRRCPYAMRARMALKIADTQYVHREVLLREKPAEMLLASPKGSVPIFVLPSGDVIDESFDIMLWALQNKDPKNWLIPDMETMTSLIKQIEGPFAQDQFRYKYASFFDESLKRGDVDLTHRDAACEHLHPYEEILSNNTYLMGSQPSLADIATFPFIRQFAAVEPDWWNAPQFPHIQSWLSYFVNTDLFSSVMEKYPLFISAHE